MDETPMNLPAKVEKKSLASFVPDLAQNVTAENYLAKAQGFLKLNKGGFLIALKDGKNQGLEFKQTVAQWGAWRAYYVQRKISVKFMDAQGKDGKCWTVPAEWPHLFDMDATVQRDHQAGEWFKDNYRPENRFYADALTKAATVAAMRSRIPSDGRRKSTPRDHLQEPLASSVDMDLLMKSHDDGLNGVHKRRPQPEPEF